MFWFIGCISIFDSPIFHFRVNPIRELILQRAQRDLNPRPTAPQAVILSKLNYEPTYVPTNGEL